MKPYPWMSCLMLFGVLACASDARAQAEGRRLALVIGTSEYETLPDLDKALDDALTVGTVLKDKAGFDVTRVLDQDSASLRHQVADFAAGIQTGDVVVIYYAGHGVQSGGRNYLIPTDFPDDASQLATIALSADKLLKTIDAKDPLIILLILDACRNSPLSGVRNAGLAHTEPKALGAGTRIELAARDGEVATDGIFARHLVAALAQPGLGVDEVFVKVRESVGKETHNLQHTVSIGQMTVNFYFIPALATSPGEALADLTRLSEQMPLGELGQTAALQALVQQQQSLAGTELLEGLSFREGTFNRIDLSSARLTGTEFSKASLRNADLTRASLRFATLTDADLSEARADGAEFTFVLADSARFTNAHAKGSTWFAARAHGVDFKGADLSGAGFAFADLRGAAFDDANLTNAVFLGSDLRGATFAGALLDGTDFTGSRLDAGALTSTQARAACQLEIPLPATYVVSVVAIEPIPGAQFSGGVEYSRFYDDRHVVRLASTGFETCAMHDLPENDWFPYWRAGDRVRVREDIDFRLSHRFLQQSGRRAGIRSRIQRQLEWMDSPGH